MLHMDLMCPMLIENIREKRYTLACVDDFFRFTNTIYLRDKTNVVKPIIRLIR